MDEQLYRITSLESFLSLLIHKKERYVNPIDKWEDTYEGYFLQFLNDEDRFKEIITRLYNDISKRAYITTCRNITKLLGSRYDCYGICWSTVKDSDAMWRIYSYGKKSIQLTSNENRIREMLKNAGRNDKDITIKKVKYDLVNDDDIYDKMINTRVALDEAYFHKREAFSHEKELRVIIHENSLYEERTRAFIQSVKYNLFADTRNEIAQVIENVVNEQYIKRYYDDQFRKKELFLDVPVISEYIEGVRIHPMAEDWYDALIREICKRYDLNYYGKSDLYERPLTKKKSKRSSK